MSEQRISKEEPMLERLMRVLLEEISACDYLAETLAEKQDAIVKNNLLQINTLTGTEQLIVNKANLLAKARQDLIGDLFLKANIKNMGFTLSNLIENLGLAEQTNWKKVQQRLENAVAKIERINKENITLLNSSISFVRDMIHLLYSHDDKPTNIYDKSGLGLKRINSKSMVDCNI